MTFEELLNFLLNVLEHLALKTTNNIQIVY